MEAKTSLQKAIDAVGSQAALASKIGKTQQTISHWLKTGRVPAEMVLPVETASGVSRHELRPDIFGDAPTTVAA